MEEGQINVSKNDEDNKLILRIKKIYEGWLSIRAKVEEIMEPVLFFGGGILIALIALGILPWGALGIGICATLTFIGISRFILTNSWTRYHNNWNEKQPKGTGFVHNEGKTQLVGFIKMFGLPLILFIAGVVLVMLGVTGVLGLGLALGIGIPSLVLVGMCVTACWIFGLILGKQKQINIDESNNLWGLCMLIAGLASVATFAVLGLTGVLAWSTAIALGAPALALAVVITLIFVGTRIGFWVKNKPQ